MDIETANGHTPETTQMTNLSPKTTEVLAALRSNVEGCDDNGFRDVYLDNARPAGMSAHAFAGHLSALEKAGLYRPYGDDCFGRVKIATV